MKALAAMVALLFVAVLGVGQLRELTQNRADELVEGTETVVEVDVATRDYPRGDQAAVQALACPGAACERLFGPGQDIEWALSGGKPWLLQSRPITT